VGHGHGTSAGPGVVALTGVAAAWLLGRWHVGVRGQDRVGFVAMGASMLVMIGVHIAPGG
jgi:hypothetical protein